MKKDGPDIKPPQWAERLLSWYCRPELLEDLQGDLNEYFDRNVKKKGVLQASWIYIIDVFKFFRLYTIRKPEFINLLIQWIMIGSYVKTSSRSIVRNKLFSTINIVGLAVSMSVGLLLIGLLSDMFSYDRFHEKGARIYRVISEYQYLDEVDDYLASTSPRVGKEIKETISGIEEVALLRRGMDSDVKAGDKTIPLKGHWADEGLFKVFSFHLLEGNPDVALKDPFSIVLTQTAAKKLFGDGSALGKVVTLFKEKEFTVTGIIQDPPKFSHLKFEMLGSLSTRPIIEKDNWDSEMKWDNIWQDYTYLLLPDGANLNNIQNNLTALAEENDKTVKNTKIKLALQPLYDIALGDDLSNPIGPVMSTSEVWVIVVLTIIVILSACFNYTNLSIARATRRSREIGIRKVIGALKGHVLGQFLMEAVIISMIALGLSFILFLILKPYFLTLQPKMQELLELNLSLKVILSFLALAIGVGMLAGFLPALLFSKINAIHVIKNNSSLRLFRHLNLRKSMIVLQYTISLMFIATTIIGLKQYKYLLAFDLGYSTENILNINLNGNREKASILTNELNSIPEVQGVSQSLMVTSTGNYWSTRVKYKDPMDSSTVHFNGINEKYIPLHNIKLLAGRNFTALPDSVDESEVIVNEALLKRFKIAAGDPLNALDEILEVDHKKMKIVGVLKDFHYGKADTNDDEEVMFRYHKKKANFLNVKIATSDWIATLSKIDNAWKKIDDVHPLEAQLYSDKIAQSYGEIAAMIKMISFLAFLAICIACFGLLGMVIFTTETRLKEISIRKVLGASEGKLIYLLSKGFLVLLFVSGAIALPATYLFFDRVAFMEMKNHITIKPFDLLAGFFAVLIIALLMIGSQTLKVARTNPASVLKNE